jgi:hypothetical protein
VAGAKVDETAASPKPFSPGMILISTYRVSAPAGFHNIPPRPEAAAIVQPHVLTRALTHTLTME